MCSLQKIKSRQFQRNSALLTNDLSSRCLNCWLFGLLVRFAIHTSKHLATSTTAVSGKYNPQQHPLPQSTWVSLSAVALYHGRRDISSRIAQLNHGVRSRYQRLALNFSRTLQYHCSSSASWRPVFLLPISQSKPKWNDERPLENHRLHQPRTYPGHGQTGWTDHRWWS